MIDFKAGLLENTDIEYKAFQEKLIPGITDILGVRMPIIRKLSSAILKDQPEKFLELQAYTSHEERILNGLVIGGLPGGLKDNIEWIRAFVPIIDNWAACDSFCSSLKGAKKEAGIVLTLAEEFLQQGGEYPSRFAYVLLLNYGLGASEIRFSLEMLSAPGNPGYYARMAAAWGLAEAYVYYPAKVAAILEDEGLDQWTKRKAHQKIRESTRTDGSLLNRNERGLQNE